MRIRIKCTIVLFAVAAVFVNHAGAQDTKASDKPFRSQLAVDYSYMRSNAPPGGCTCFNLNGGNANLAWPVRPGGFSITADLTVDKIGNVNSSSFSLTLVTFTVGTRYTPRLRHTPLQPFGQAMIGFAHASGSATLPPNPLANNASLAFAANLGGGLDLHISRRFSFRVAEADYLLTTFDNGSNNHQNNLRASAGVVLRF